MLLYFLMLCLSLSLPCFPARTLPDKVTVITADNRTATWQGFTSLVNAEFGSHVSGISELKKYFNRFGYLPVSDPDNITDLYDAELEAAVSRYQTRLGLAVTGKLDSETISVVSSPRCGVSDAVNSSMKVVSRYAFFEGTPRWDREEPMTLSYGFPPEHGIDYLTTEEVTAVLRRAFARWAAAIPVNFIESQDYENADIRIGFYSGDHGDGEPFDGVLGVLAHAFSPEDGRLHFDAAERWAVNFKVEDNKKAVDLESVATHEIGHLLGLGHSSVEEAVMYPRVKPRTKKVDLTIDDVEGIQALYGSNPNFKMSSLLESEKSMNHGTNNIGESRKLIYMWAILGVVVLLALV